MRSLGDVMNEIERLNTLPYREYAKQQRAKKYPCEDPELEIEEALEFLVDAKTYIENYKDEKRPCGGPTMIDDHAFETCYRIKYETISKYVRWLLGGPQV